MGLATHSLGIKGFDGQARILGDRLKTVETAIVAGTVDDGTLRKTVLKRMVVKEESLDILKTLSEAESWGLEPTEGKNTQGSPNHTK